MIATRMAGLQVQLVNAFRKPFDNAIATARTCYSAKGIIDESQVVGEGLTLPEREAVLARRDAILTVEQVVACLGGIL